MSQVYFIDGPHDKNIYSQYGEDGVIERLISDLSIDIEVLCEFGAWDGKHFSNTFALQKVGRSLIMIEGDPAKYLELLETQKEYPSIHAINCFVEPMGKNSLDSILSRGGIASLDLLSIDIDGYDLQIAKNLHLNPKILVVEFNPTFGVFKKYESKIGESSGNSFKSICDAMIKKGYFFVAFTKTNLFFVKKEIILSAGFDGYDINSFDRLKDIDDAIYQISSAYNGRAIEFGSPKNPWDGCRLANVYKHPSWVYGWEPTYIQIMYRAVRTLSPVEIIRGIKKAHSKGWFRF